MSNAFTAIVADRNESGVSAELRELHLSDLPDNDMLVAVSHSTLNYKDALAVSGRGKICRFFPMVCGIDLAGTVIESGSADFAPGDRVLVNGFGMSESHWGGYSQRQRVNSAWAVPIPEAFSAEQAMAIGTAGYTAMLCVQALRDGGVMPDQGPVVVTGASGGVGSVALILLAALGYESVAVSGRCEENEAFLKGLGASRLMPRSDLARPARPLESERWAGAIDVAGGETLATVLSQARYGSTVAACGLAESHALSTTVMPFILRGVTLAGIDSVMAPMARRLAAWRELARLLDLERLAQVYQVRPLAEVPELAVDLLDGRIRGRVVVTVDD